MQQFKIRKEEINKLKRKVLVILIPVCAIMSIIAIVTSILGPKVNESGVNVAPFYIVFVLIILGFGFNRGVKRQKAMFESYTLTITNNMISRDQLNNPTISIYFNEIREIVKYKDGRFVIHGKAATDKIYIPSWVDNYMELEARLNSISPIVTKRKLPLLQKYSVLFTLLAIVMNVSVYAVSNKIVVAICGTLVTALMAWSFYEILRSKNVDNKFKRTAWWILLLIASIVSVMIRKLTGS